MESNRLGAMEYRFMKIIWNSEPVSSMQLVQRCSEQFGWKKSTTYTMLKRLQQKGMVQNIKTVVTSLVSQKEVLSNESEYVISETFEGSLPSFITAFLGRKRLSEKEADELRELIDSYRKK